MKSRTLRSPHNPTVKKAVKLRNRPEKYAPTLKNPSGEVLIEGPRTIETAIESGAAIKLALVREDALRDDGHGAVIERLLSLAVPVYVLDRAQMDRISGTVTPQGMIAVCGVEAKPLDRISPGRDELLVVSDGIQDPGNTGTIIRICDAAGIRVFISLKGSANPFTPKVIRASAGSVFNLDIVLAERKEFLKWCRRHDMPVIVTAPDAEKTVFDFDLEGGGAVVLGSESRGVSSEVRDASFCSLKVPIYGRAESLNVAATAAITIYELVRKRSAARPYPARP
ncbi:MAG: RNA methyltransferase [Nitrospirae bacterium]|nr:RNA methyltransferase [Nitrospirota bacterium]